MEIGLLRARHGFVTGSIMTQTIMLKRDLQVLNDSTCRLG